MPKPGLRHAAQADSYTASLPVHALQTLGQCSGLQILARQIGTYRGLIFTGQAHFQNLPIHIGQHIRRNSTEIHVPAARTFLQQGP